MGWTLDQENKAVKAALYCRLSSEDLNKADSREESESIQNQKLLLTDYAGKKGWEIFRIYADEDYSGMDRSRPAFCQMLSDAGAGLFSVILCKTQSRFTRDMELVERYIHGEFPKWGIRFVTVVDHIDTALSGNKKARQINGLINEWYCEDLSENIRAVLRRKMEDGQFIGSFAPYGYQKDTNDRHTLAVDPEAAAVVKEIFALYRSGYGVYKISRILNSRQILPPSVYKQKAGLPFYNPNAPAFGVWAPGSVSRILKNPVYTGVLAQGKERKISYKEKRAKSVPREDWIIVPGRHPALISSEAFGEVQRLLSSRRIVGKEKPGTEPSFLSGRIFCRECKATMQKAAPSRDGKSFYLRCGRNRRTGECTPHTIRLSVVEEAARELLFRELARFFASGENRQAVLAALAETSRIQGVKKPRGGLLQIQKALADAYVDRACGRLSEEGFLRLSEELKRREAELVLEEGQRRERAQEPCRADFELWVAEWRTHLVLTPGICGAYLDRVEIGMVDGASKTQEVTFFWK